MKKLLTFIFLLFTIPAYAATYHVATDGSGDFTTIAQVNAATFSPGDKILFRRGDTWRGQLIPDSGSSAGYITYGAYGTGAKPLLLGSVDLSSSGGWTDEGGNLWYATSAVQVGNIIFDNETSCGVKCALKTDLDTQDEFWWDDPNDRVYVFSVGNPGTVHTKIECALSNDIILLSSKNYVKLNNLDLRYTAVHAIDILHSNYFYVEYCDISYIGGGYYTATARYGNGIQITGNSTYGYIDRNKVSNVFDAGITPQGEADNRTMSNIFIRNNIIDKCEYNIEWWFKGTNSSMSNVYIEHNTCINAGSGWGHNQRWGAGVNGRNLMIYSFTASGTNLFFRNNILSESTETAIRVSRLADLSKFVIDYNNYYESAGNFAYIADTDTYVNLSDWQSATSQDTHSIASDPLLTPSYRLKPGSPAINAGEAGLGVTDDYAGNPRIGTPDIGAFESGNFIHNATIRNATLN